MHLTNIFRCKSNSNTLPICFLLLLVLFELLLFSACVNGQQKEEENTVEESGEEEEETGEISTAEFDVYFTCEGIVDWRVEKICKYMHEADNYIRNHPPKAPPMPGSVIEVEEEEGEEETVPESETVIGEAGESPVAPAPPAPGAAKGGRTNLYGDEAAKLTAAGGGKKKKVVKKIVPYNALDCATLDCLCHYMDDTKCSPTKRLKKSVRKEYRMLTDEERQKLHAAMNELKKNGVYDNLVVTHQRFSNESVGAHFGPAFLPWHREYNKRMEFALRMVDPDVSLAYWDSTIEDALTQPNDSMLFTDEMMGSTDPDGGVGGDFKDWLTAGERQRLKRKVGHFTVDPKNASAGIGKPMSEIDITRLLEGSHMEYFLAYSTPRNQCLPLLSIVKHSHNKFNLSYVLEYPHNYVHQFIGGHMGDTPLSSNDPIFFVHHPFIDYLWEMFRQRYQSRTIRTEQYPTDDEGCSSKYHFKNQQMLPFWQMPEPEKVRVMRNVDGLANEYTDNIYEYAPRPSCSMGANCGSKYLFCDRSGGRERCVARLKLGGKCKGFEHADICYHGRCVNGVCVDGAGGGGGGSTASEAQKPEQQTEQQSQPAQSIQQKTEEQSAEEQQKSQEQQGAAPGIRPANNKYGDDVVAQQIEEREASNSDNQKKRQSSVHKKHHRTRPTPTNNNATSPKQPSVPKQSGQPKQKPQPRQAEAVDNNGTTTTITTTPTNNGGPQQQQRLMPPSQPSSDPSSPSLLPKHSQQQQPQQQQQCFNHYQCCAIWASQGECQRNVEFMLHGCRASCRQCVPNYNLNIECADRMHNCEKMVQAGDCQRRWRFMQENCRQSCGYCGTTRAQACARFVGTNTADSVTTTTAAQHLQKRLENSKMKKNGGNDLKPVTATSTSTTTTVSTVASSKRRLLIR